LRDLSEEAAAEAEDGGGGCGRLGLSMTMADWRKSRRRRSGRLGFGESEGGRGWMDRRQALLFWGKPKEEQWAVRW
jgi:hypothetical protein